MIDIKPLIELAEKATPDWRENGEFGSHFSNDQFTVIVDVPQPSEMSDDQWAINKAFVFSMNPQTALALLRELAAARDCVEALRISRGQWIHSVNAKRSIQALENYDQAVAASGET